MQDKKYKIIVYPTDDNPYQSLLYGELSKIGVEYSYIKFSTRSATLRLIEIFYLLYKYKKRNFSIFHLHWLYPFQSPFNNQLLNNIFTRFFFTLYLIILISWIKFLRYKIVWTLHNLVPHERIFIDDVLISRWLTYQADKIIVHSPEIVNLMNKLDYYTYKTVIIPHGNYINSYETKIDKTAAREELLIPPNQKTILYFGRIRKYKGVVDLVDQFNSLNKELNIKLFIVGECRDVKLKNIIKHKIIDNNIKCIFKKLDNHTLSLYISACDVVVLPFKKITTSGSAILALSFGKPIIAPKIGGLIDFPSDVGFFYATNERVGIANQIMTAFDNFEILKIKTNACYSYVQKLSWAHIAQDTKKIYNQLIIA